jgi:hypothetical protein
LKTLEEAHDPLDDIVHRFNERWFQGWSATPEEQRIKFIHIADSIRAHPDFDHDEKVPSVMPTIKIMRANRIIFVLSPCGRSNLTQQRICITFCNTEVAI